MRSWPSEWAVVTGASSGLGIALAIDPLRAENWRNQTWPRRFPAAAQPDGSLNSVKDARATGVVYQSFPTTVCLSTENSGGDEL